MAHQKKSRSKLHGHGTEAIYIGPSKNSFHRSGLFLNLVTRDVIVRRSFQVWNERPFYDFILNIDALIEHSILASNSQHLIVVEGLFT